MEADRVVSLSGKISIEADKAPVIIVDKMWEFTLDEDKPIETNNAAKLPVEPSAKPVEKPQEKVDVKKTLWLNVTTLDEEDVEELLETLTFYAGETEVYFVTGRTKSRCSQKVSPNKALMAELSSFLPSTCIKLV